MSSNFLGRKYPGSPPAYWFGSRLFVLLFFMQQVRCQYYNIGTNKERGNIYMYIYHHHFAISGVRHWAYTCPWSSSWACPGNQRGSGEAPSGLSWGFSAAIKDATTFFIWVSWCQCWFCPINTRVSNPFTNQRDIHEGTWHFTSEETPMISKTRRPFRINQFQQPHAVFTCVTTGAALLWKRHAAKWKWTKGSHSYRYDILFVLPSMNGIKSET